MGFKYDINDKIESVEFYFSWVIDCMDLPRGGWEIFENDILEYDCMGGSLESDCKDKSNVNFFNDKIESVESYCRLMIGCM